MVPLSITLRNFLSYGENDVTLDFTSMHVVCLSGENGHGKSALLDAITWALWGETRLGKQGHEQLIRIGADEMSVTLTFRVGTDIYRIKRQRSRRTSGAAWEIQRSDLNGLWRPLTGITSSDTGRTIQQIVRMSYDTFLNSAYLKQGRADEFVRQTSNKRKEILCDILELSRYDRLEEKAKQSVKEFNELALDADRQANAARASAADGARYQEALLQEETNLRMRLADHATSLNMCRQSEQVVNELNSQIRQRAGFVQQLSTCQESIKKSEADLNSAQNEVTRLNALLMDRASIESDYLALQAARFRDQQLALSLQELHDTELTIQRLSSLTATEALNLQHSINRVQRDVEISQEALKQVTLIKQEMAILADKQKVFDGVNEHLNQLKATEASIATVFAELKVQNEHIDREIKAEIARQDRLQNQNETCSVCGSPLTKEKVKQLIIDSKQVEERLRDEQGELRNKGVSEKRKLADVTKSVKDAEEQLSELALLNNEWIRLDQLYHQAQERCSQLGQQEASIQFLRHQLGSNNYAKETFVQLAEHQAKLSELLPLREEHTNNIAMINRLSGVEKVHIEALHAEQNMQSEQRAIAFIQRHLSTLAAQELDLKSQLQNLSSIEIKLMAADREMKQIFDEERSLAQHVSNSQMEIGRLQRSIEQCADANTQVLELEEKYQNYRMEESLYKALTSAFGKRGIQASIIENALPELELYTNQILDRLTDGDLRVFIETTRQAKAKNASPVETLEIKISDSLGTRPLEMYSGGEAFRVSFALRIALSMLLVRRSGAELQTLIIDEGFGTQDTKGREKLVDAINAIKQDFDQIMVITHIEELKEAFATRIEVYKTSEGSQLRVVHGDAIG